MERLFRQGTVSSVDYENALVSVTYKQFDDATTAKLPYFSYTDEYKMPQVGSEVLVIHDASGNAAGVIMGRHWSKKNKCLHAEKDVWRKELAPETKYGKCWMEYDDKTETMRIIVPKRLEIIVGDCSEHGEPGEILIQANGDNPKIDIECMGADTSPIKIMSSSKTAHVTTEATGLSPVIDVTASGASTNINFTSAGASANITDTTKNKIINAESTVNSGPCAHVGCVH